METFAKNIEQIVDYSNVKLQLLSKYMEYFIKENKQSFILNIEEVV